MENICDELDKERFVCMDCGGTFSAIEGTWPQYSSNGEMVYSSSEDNNRSRFEFVCYNCCE